MPLNFPGMGQVKAVKGSRLGSSIYNGASWASRRKEWVANSVVDGKSTHLGNFDDENEPASKYDKAATRTKKLFNIAEAKSPAVRALKKQRASLKVIGFVREFNRSCLNIVCIHSSSKSRYTGVNWISQSNKWKAEMKFDGKSSHLGCFDDEEEAARKHDEVSALLGKPLFFSGEGKVEAVKGSKGDSSRYKGVSWYSRSNKWKAQITIDGKLTYLGYFRDEDDAAHKYDESAAPLGRPLNFSGKGQIETVEGRCLGPSRYMGVSWNRPRNKWIARISIDGKTTFLGAFKDEVDAARKYDEAAAPLGMPLNLGEDVDISGASNPAMVAAVIWINGERTHLGYFESEEKAAQKYVEVALNFKETSREDQLSFQMNQAKAERLKTIRARSAEDSSALPDKSPVVVRVGTQIRKIVSGIGVFDGTVVKIFHQQAENDVIFRVRYEDGDIEDLTRAEVEGLVISAPFQIVKHALLRTPPTANSRSKRKAAVAALLGESRNRTRKNYPSVAAGLKV
jgi:hypothetical protein